NPYDGNVRIRECKEMIKALHDAGISVVMDVVYNHVYDIKTVSFEKMVPNYYFRMNADGSYSQASGCGNDTASERAMFRNFMIDSCRYWVDEYHVDGFRFDLMGLHDSETMNLIRNNLDQVDERITMWGEGWYMGSNFPTKTCTGAALRGATQTNGSLNERIGFFSDEIRNALKGSVFESTAKGWLQGTGSSANTIVNNIRANPSNISNPVPSKVVQYSSCHDNQTLWDRLAASQSISDFRARNTKLVQQTKLNAAFLNTSQGITFTLAGDEFGRSKDNDDNSYKSSPIENMLDWSLAESNADIVSYYAGMREIRENFSPFTANDRTAGCKTGFINPVYKKVGVADVLQTSDGYSALWTNNVEGEWNKVLVLTNNKSKTVEFTLDNDENKDWVIIANAEQAGVKSLGEVNDNVFTLAPFSAIVAVDKASFEDIGVSSDRGTVKVKAVDTVTGNTIDSYAITGTIGSGYSVVEPTSIGLEYELQKVDGDMSGVFTADDKVVTLEYGYFVPNSVKNVDLTGDGKTNINDATALQLHIAGLKTMADEYLNKADVTTDGKKNINDVTMIQRYIAGLSVGLGTVTVNYYINGTADEKAVPSTTYTGRVGTNYSSHAASMLGYQVDTENFPIEEVTVVYGNV
ncbi:MAG: MucBP domain-containing protein, partial [Ruminococcus sp.]|nr:MucBP domain-containing protein [Ruminococcus sp.]